MDEIRRAQLSQRDGRYYVTTLKIVANSYAISHEPFGGLKSSDAAKKRAAEIAKSEPHLIHAVTFHGPSGVVIEELYRLGKSVDDYADILEALDTAQEEAFDTFLRNRAAVKGFRYMLSMNAGGRTGGETK